jgi:hypothetical protein
MLNVLLSPQYDASSGANECGLPMDMKFGTLNARSLYILGLMKTVVK